MSTKNSHRNGSPQSSLTTQYTAIDSFCGAGGLSFGLEEAGFNVLAAFDSNEIAIETYNSNLPKVGFTADARKLSTTHLLAKAGNPQSVDLFAGGPPCQGFSKQKRGAHNGDSRNDLVLEYVRFVRSIRPRFFLLENVDQLGGKRGRTFVSELQSVLSDYVLSPEFFNSADFGVAQTRLRFVIVGKRTDIQSEYESPKPTVRKWRTVGKAFQGLPEPPEDYSEHTDFANHYLAKVTKTNIERFSHVPQGGGWEDIPFELRLKCHQIVDRSSGGWPDVYGRLKADGQAPTVTGGFDSFTRGRYGHPLANRPITPREAARLQGFPDWFRFHGTRWDIRHQIGNAVPCPLSKAIGESIKKTLALEDQRLSASVDKAHTNGIHRAVRMTEGTKTRSAHK
ncbi:MAG: DNA cytosine methyltransferase [Bryobacteraceae bacterium]